VRFFTARPESQLEESVLFSEESLPVDLLLALCIAFATVTLSTLLLAGFTEISFLPAKAILKLERKAETEKVREQLELLLRSGDCMTSLDVCNFLSLGMATYFNSSETQKEGRCFVRRHESTQEYFMQQRRQRCSLFCIRCDCRMQLKLANWRGGLKERWLVLRKDGIALFSSIMDTDPTDMLFFDTSFALFRDEEDHVLVKGASWTLELSFGDQGYKRQSSAQGWCNAITVTAQLSTRTKEQRFGSFAPLRSPAASKDGDRHLLRRNMSRYLINGRAICRSVAEAIHLAQHEIFVLSFFLSPHLPLIRDGDPPLPGVSDSKVSTLLKHAADRGVRVYVLLFHETILPNDSEYAESELRHNNIYVVRHRSRFDSNLLWTHHEKVVVVDQQLAIVGGLDLCLGRFDDWRHRISDPNAETWPGQDYYNPRIKDVADGRSQCDLLDRQKHPRLPWQDIACQFLGRSARDVARHCVERWNHARSINVLYHHLPTALLRRKVAVCNDKMLSVPIQAGDVSWPPERGTWQDCQVQVVRSVGRWSAGTKTESSSHQAYCNLIQESKHFIYIENQFLCSGMDGDEVIGNRVIEALYRRLVKAHDQQESFHVMIVLPLLPCLEVPLDQACSSQSLFRVMHAQSLTLRGLKSQLKARGIDDGKFISVFGLRTHGYLEGLGPATEQIYVHSKAMVIDDEVTVVGSANINDRSLLGMRDSEVNMVVHDDRRASPQGGLAANLRKALFAQHLGWSKEDVEEVYAFPASKESIAEIRRIAKRNTQIYEELFGALPSDSVQTWAELQARRNQASSALGDFTKVPSKEEAAEALKAVQGHLVEFPLDFLLREDLAPSIVSGFLGPVFT